MSSIPEVVSHPDYNIQYTSSMDDYDETEPLLRPRRSNTNWLFICFLFLLLCCGLIVGIYLLIKEKEWDDDEPYHREIIESKLHPKLNFTMLSRFELPLSKVLLSEIHGPPCNSSESCIESIRKLHPENRANHQGQCIYIFLITDKGSVYEYLDWDILYYADCDNDTLNIILLDKFDSTSPSKDQLNQVISLLDYAVHINKLTNCYSVLTRSKFNETGAVLLDFANSLRTKNQLKYNC